MTQTLDFHKMDLNPISNEEAAEIDGGKMPNWMKSFGIGWLINQVISNWDEIKEGAKEGWNSVQYK